MSRLVQYSLLFRNNSNLSDRIVHTIVDLHSNSERVKSLKLMNADDVVIWEYAKTKQDSARH